MNVNDVSKLNDAVMQAWNDHDTESFLRLCDENIVWSDLASPEPLKGKKGASQFFENWTTGFPDFRLRVLNKVITEDSIAVELEFTGTNTGPLRMGNLPEIPATQKKVASRGCYFGRVKNGKFTSVNTYPDLAGMMAQLGLMQEAHHA